MNLKRFLAATLVAFAFIFFYEWLVHGFLLKHLYMLTPNVWRNEVEMVINIPKAMLYQFGLAIWLAFIFTRFYREGGVYNGLQFGLYFGIFAGILSSSWYLWLPVSSELSVSWFFASFVEFLGVGLLLGSIYKEEDVY